MMSVHVLPTARHLCVSDDRWRALSWPDMWNRQQHHDVREALFGGRACVRVWDLAPNPATPFAAVLACELEAGGRVGAHVQEHFPEIVIGVEGAGSVFVNGARLEFGAGRVAEVPLGQTLAVSNDSAQEPLRYLIVKARSAASE